MGPGEGARWALSPEWLENFKPHPAPKKDQGTERVRNEFTSTALSIAIVEPRPEIARDRLRHGGVCRRPRDLRRADVAVAVEVAERGRLCVEED